jgi:hypothetical protein
MPERKHVIIALVVIAFFAIAAGLPTKAYELLFTPRTTQQPPSVTGARVTETWPPVRRRADVQETTLPTSTAMATLATGTPTTTTGPIVGVGAESPSYIAPINQRGASEGIRDAAFEEVASTLLSANRVVDERISPVISSKNGGLLPNLDVRGDYEAMMCGNEQLADDCGCWNRSSAQRGIKLGYIKDTDRRRVVLAGP